MTTNRFTSRLNNDEEYQREMLIKKIERSVEQLRLPQLEALYYDMLTKGYVK